MDDTRDVTLVLDVGSSSVRCTAFAFSGEVLPCGARSPVSADASSGLFDAAELRVAAESALQATCSTLASLGCRGVSRVCFAEFVMSLVGVDAVTGEPRTPVMAYCARGARLPAAVAALARELDARAYHDRVGVALHPAYAPAQLVAFYASSPSPPLPPLPLPPTSLPRSVSPPPPPEETPPLPLERAGADLVWTSATSFLIGAWAGVPPLSVGVSPSQAAWSGLLDLRSAASAFSLAAAAQRDGASSVALGGPVAASAASVAAAPPAAVDAVADTAWRWDELTLEAIARCIAGRGDGDGAAPSSGAWRPRLVPIRRSGAFVVAGAARTPDCSASPAPAIAALLGQLFRPGLRLHLGLGDGAAAALGSAVAGRAGASVTGVLAVSVGTSAAARAVLPLRAASVLLCFGGCADPADGGAGAPAASAAAMPSAGPAGCAVCGRARLSSLGLFCYPFSEAEALVGGAITDGGALVDHIARQFVGKGGGGGGGGGDGDGDDAHQGGEARPSASIVLLPFPSGERAPGWHGDARLAILGLDYASLTPAHLRRAAVDGVVFRLRAIVDRLRPLLDAATSGGGDWAVVASGGAVDNEPRWALALAAALARPVNLFPAASASASASASAPAAGSVGAALAPTAESTTVGAFLFCAREGAAPARSSSIAVALALEGPAPSPAAVAAYAAAYSRHSLVYDALAPLHEKILGPW